MQRTRLSLPKARRAIQKNPNLPGIVALFFLPVLFLIRHSGLFASPVYGADPAIERINEIVNELRAELQMQQEVQVRIAKDNPLMVSVERIGRSRTEAGIFVICFDESFLASLDADELRAALAHELGHVWIFSHHPYLQTEALANEIALRVVQRGSSKLWDHLGARGNVDEFLGVESAKSAQR
jgi:hypothetical protein